MMTTFGNPPSRERELRRHPVRGAIWGLLLGIGVAIYLVLFAVVAFGDWLLIAVVALAGAAVGVAWAYVAPPKRSADGPPAGRIEHTVAATAATAPTAPAAAADLGPGHAVFHTGGDAGDDERDRVGDDGRELGDGGDASGGTLDAANGDDGD